MLNILISITLDVRIRVLSFCLLSVHVILTLNDPYALQSTVIVMIILFVQICVNMRFVICRGLWKHFIFLFVYDTLCCSWIKNGTEGTRSWIIVYLLCFHSEEQLVCMLILYVLSMSARYYNVSVIVVPRELSYIKSSC